MNFEQSELIDIVDNLGVGIYVADGNGVTIWVNKVFEQISLISKNEVIGKSLKELVGSKYFSNSATLHILKTKSPVTVSFNTKTGKRLLSQGKPIFDNDGRLKYVVNTIYDISNIFPDDKKENNNVLPIEYGIVAQSDKMQRVLNIAIKASNIDLPVLIYGETGTGKEVVAKLIHYAGKYKNRPFIPINCAAIPESLLESELFGYEPGSFTGSNKAGKKGILELANKGTILLDEIGEMPFVSQAKLLRFLEEKEFMKIGSSKPTKVDVRVIAATNRDLRKLMLEGKFRKDLYYRLSTIYIYIPPLRERVEDIKMLAKYFLDNLNDTYKTKKLLSPELIRLLETLRLEGNVRELRGIVERMFFYSKSDIISIKDYYESDSMQKNNPHGPSENLKDMVESYEKSILEEFYLKYRSTRKVAKALKVSQSSIFKKLKKYGII